MLHFDFNELFYLQVNPLNDIEKLLDCEMRPTVADDSDASKLGSKQIFVKQYLVKWKGLSYLHCTWYIYLSVYLLSYSFKRYMFC